MKSAEEKKNTHNKQINIKKRIWSSWVKKKPHFQTVLKWSERSSTVAD